MGASMANGSVRILATTLAACAALTANAASAETKCELGRYFEVPVTIQGSAAFMDVKVNGVDSRFQIDTGAFFSTITPDGAKRLRLSEEGLGFGRELTVNGVGGSEDASVTTAKSFDFAGVPLKNIQFVVAGRRLTGETGLIGENLLGTFAEVDYDFGKGKIGFYKVKDCHGVDVAYWANKDGSDDWIPIESRPERGTPKIIGTVTINGRKLRAEFDSGAHATIMTLGAAARAGIRPDSPGVRPSHGAFGFGHRTSKTWIAPVSSFVIGHEEIKTTQMEFGDIELGDDADLLLGIDFFLAHHIFVVHSQDRLYFTYNGGPVFKLDEPEAPGLPSAPTGAAPSGAGPAAGPDAGSTAGSSDPDTLDREGAALMARHEYEAALKAFVCAAELDPKTASRWLSRARAELALKHPVLAMSDLDRSIELKPDDVTARMMRGELLLNRGEFGMAQADFEAAAKAAPPGDDVRLRIAAAYDRHERWAEAIPHLDAWLEAHSRESTAPVALNMRCWARAMLGQDLDKALADCDAAIRQDRNFAYLDSRGLVHLRMGQLKAAIEDYDAALRAAPKMAWSLYGRGLAKKRLGQTAEGEADIQAAVVLNPDLPKQASKIGLVDAAAPAAPAAKPAS
jgi:tetratricopeptide (TPR) repeat protein/predicted aspartyl protease